MAQLRLGYPEIQRYGGKVLQIAVTPAKLGPLYARRFNLPFPYLCDEKQVLFRRYGLKGTGGKLTALKRMLETVPGSFAGMLKGEQPSPRPYLSNPDVDPTMEEGIFLVGQDQKIRFSHVAGPHSPIPPIDILLRELQALS